MAAGRVGRRKLNRMETGPYQRALLNCGITTKVDAEDERVPVLQQAMEYTGAVGTMVMDEAPVPVPAPGMVYQLVPIEDLGEESEEVEDLEIEEGLAIEIAAMDPAPAYTE